MKTAAQLLREFWLPFGIAIAWTAYNFYAKGISASEPVTLRDVVTVFGPTFFLASWMTGQFFRVRKQKAVELGLSTIDKRVHGMLDNIEAIERRIVNQLTGGNSYCHLLFDATGLPIDVASFFLVHAGEYPLYDLEARIVDLDVFESIKGHLDSHNYRDADTVVKIGTLNPGQHFRMPSFTLKDHDSRGFNVFFTARNGNFVQSIRMCRKDGEWLSATKVDKGTSTLTEHVQNGFPREFLEDSWSRCPASA